MKKTYEKILMEGPSPEAEPGRWIFNGIGPTYGGSDDIPLVDQCMKDQDLRFESGGKVGINCPLLDFNELHWRVDTQTAAYLVLSKPGDTREFSFRLIPVCGSSPQENDGGFSVMRMKYTSSVNDIGITREIYYKWIGK